MKRTTASNEIVASPNIVIANALTYPATGVSWVILARITEAPTTPKATTPMRRKSRLSGSAWHRRHHSMARARTVPPRRGMRCKVMSGAARVVDGRSQSAASTSAAARSPDRIAPSMLPCDTVAVSLPAQWIRPTGARSARPNWVRTPGGMCAMKQPRVHRSSAQSISS